MDKGGIAVVSFTGRETESGRVFDTTDEKTARESGIYRENAIFRPVPIILGKGELIKGLEEELEKMREGEHKTVKLQAEKAFGPRRKELVVVVPLQEFKNRNVQPFPGLVVELNDRYGRVQSVSGGRVRVDLNSDLAGKEVEYDIKVEKELKTGKEQVQALTEKFFPLKDKKIDARIEGKELEVKLPNGLPKEISIIKDAYARTITENIKGIEKVRFVEEFEKLKEGKTEKKAEEAPVKEKK
ncbi:MAG: FKBP-type peptidyl-prolyl cis-trans isomerase [Candidatus Diapherotrites archaeon]|uniref:Peptidyl-prolyl cis-trans isomerase n=1 Tax=Candidatus Iainarchaeum sp. TaxID=3101447 RepID=A0A7J4IVY8_9ARCH|nr:MAG: FKBP-type peptidyl-prolyl cis-trans isomerase SlyD [archaeon GW2011_AR10]MBS3058918.1 FKBP-type peptidyl-prolyl cis-trans isomerase [Candidatus Diapherotrites archaeon]HIH08415.1 hypothetical protein [Candidatus Diapherotrites archaeon]